MSSNTDIIQNRKQTFTPRTLTRGRLGFQNLYKKALALLSFFRKHPLLFPRQTQQTGKKAKIYL